MRVPLVVLVALLAGCASEPPPPAPASSGADPDRTSYDFWLRGDVFLLMAEPDALWRISPDTGHMRREWRIEGDCQQPLEYFGEGMLLCADPPGMFTPLEGIWKRTLSHPRLQAPVSAVDLPRSLIAFADARAASPPIPDGRGPGAVLFADTISDSVSTHSSDARWAASTERSPLPIDGLLDPADMGLGYNASSLYLATPHADQALVDPVAAPLARGTGAVWQYDMQGEVVATWVHPGFVHPNGVDAAAGGLLVTDPGADMVFWIQADDVVEIPAQAPVDAAWLPDGRFLIVDADGIHVHGDEINSFPLPDGTALDVHARGL